jgi:hypothetical protein
LMCWRCWMTLPLSVTMGHMLALFMCHMSAMPHAVAHISPYVTHATCCQHVTCHMPHATPPHATCRYATCCYARCHMLLITCYMRYYG